MNKDGPSFNPRESAEHAGTDLREEMLDTLAHASGIHDIPEADRSRFSGSLSEQDNPTHEAAEALRDMGFEFFQVKPLTMAEFAEQHPEYVQGRNFDHLLSSDLKTFRPPEDTAVAVGIFSGDIALPDSKRKSFRDQLKLVREYSQQVIEPHVPNARAIMLPAAVLAQVDYAHSQQFGYPPEMMQDRDLDDSTLPGARVLMNTYSYTTDRGHGGSQVTLGRYRRIDDLQVRTSGNDGASNLQAVFGVVLDKRLSTGTTLKNAPK